MFILSWNRPRLNTKNWPSLRPGHRKCMCALQSRDAWYSLNICTWKRNQMTQVPSSAISKSEFTYTVPWISARWFFKPSFAYSIACQVSQEIVNAGQLQVCFWRVRRFFVASQRLAFLGDSMTSVRQMRKVMRPNRQRRWLQIWDAGFQHRLCACVYLHLLFPIGINTGWRTCENARERTRSPRTYSWLEEWS